MHQHAKIVSLKVNPVIPDPKTMQRLAATLQFAKIIQLGGDHLLRQAAKLAENLELQFLGHTPQFGGAGRIEDDLERAHRRDFKRNRLPGEAVFAGHPSSVKQPSPSESVR